jgi:hypothetical protein
MSIVLIQFYFNMVSSVYCVRIVLNCDKNCFVTSSRNILIKRQITLTNYMDARPNKYKQMIKITFKSGNNFLKMLNRQITFRLMIRGVNQRLQQVDCDGKWAREDKKAEITSKS